MGRERWGGRASFVLVCRDEACSLLPLNCLCVGIGVFILNERLNMLTNPSARMKAFQKAAIQFIEGILPMSNPIPLHKLIPTVSSIRFESSARELERISLELLGEKMAALSTALKKGESVEPIGFLEQWLAEERLDHRDILVLIRDFLSAGIDTVSLSWCIDCCRIWPQRMVECGMRGEG